LSSGIGKLLGLFSAALISIFIVPELLPAEGKVYNAEAMREMIAAYRFLGSGDQEKAAEHLRQALKLDSNSSFLKVMYSELLYEMRRYNEVIDLLEPLAASGDSVDIQALKLLAFSYEVLQKTDESIDYYKKVIQREPGDDWMRRRLLELLKNKGRIQEIIALYKPLLDPQSETYAFDLYQMGALYLNIGGREPAREYLEKAVDADSSLAEAYRLLGNLDEMEGKWSAALEHYLTFLQIRPNETEQVFGRLLAVAVRSIRPAGVPATHEDSTAADTTAWLDFLGKLEVKKAEGDTLNPALWRVMALGYEIVHCNEKAMQVYRDLALRNPEDRISRRNLLRLMFAEGKYREMIPVYQEVLNQKENTFSRDLLQLGILYLKIEDYENAEKYMKRAIAADSSLADAYQLLGHLYEIKQRWQESLGYYLTFLEKNPQGLKQTFERILTVSLQAKELEKPIVFLQKVIAEGDTSSWAAEQLGRLYYHHQEFDKALDLLRQLKQNETLSDNGYFVLGFLYARADSFSSAVEAFERVKTSRPDFIPNYLTLGRIYYRMGEMEKASGAFEEGLAKAPPGDREDSRELMFSLADVYNERGDDQKTEYFLKRVLEKDPDYAPALNFLGYFYALRGTNLKEAQELIARALKQDPKNGHYIDSMGWVLFRMGRLKAALDYIKDSLAKLGGHPEVYEHLGDIYFAMGKKDQAIEAWNKSLALKGDNESLKKKLEELSPGAGKGNNK